MKSHCVVLHLRLLHFSFKQQGGKPSTTWNATIQEKFAPWDPTFSFCILRLLHSSLQTTREKNLHPKLNAAYKKEICCHEIPAFLFSIQVFNYSPSHNKEKTSCRTNSPTNNALLCSHGWHDQCSLWNHHCMIHTSMSTILPGGCRSQRKEIPMPSSHTSSCESAPITLSKLLHIFEDGKCLQGAYSVPILVILSQ